MVFSLFCILVVRPMQAPGYATGCCRYSTFFAHDAVLTYKEMHPLAKSKNQRWSRGHKARGLGQGHKKNPRPRPRPRTAFPRTDPLEAKDRNARGQGLRAQQQVFSKKKGLQKSFSGSLQFIGVARIFDWGGLNHKSHAMTSSKICLFFT